MSTIDERVAAAELEYLARALTPPCSLGPYTLSGELARSATAVLFTARGGVFGPHADGVLKVTSSAFAPVLERETALLNEAAAAGLAGIVRPSLHDMQWLESGASRTDRPAAALALPFLGGGDLAMLAVRAGRTGGLGAALALQVGRPLGEALRALLLELGRPVAHGDVRAQNVLLPVSGAAPEEALLIDLDAARELPPDLHAALCDSAHPLPAEAARACRDDVRGFGEILLLLASGRVDGRPETRNAPFERLVDRCLARGGDGYVSLADARLWQDVGAAERAEARRGQGGESLWSTLRARLPGLAPRHP